LLILRRNPNNLEVLTNEIHIPLIFSANTQGKHMKKRIILFGVLFVLLALGLGFFLWANDALQPMPEALQALQSDDRVRVDPTRRVVI